MEVQERSRPKQVVKLQDGSVAYVSGTAVLVHVLAQQGYPMWKRLSIPSPTLVPLESEEQETLVRIRQACNVPIAL